MSRSYRKTPGWWYEKMDKKLAARLYRRTSRNKGELHQGNMYKKLDKSGDWNAYCRWTKEDAIKKYNEVTMSKHSYNSWLLEEYPTLEDYLAYWYRLAKRK